MLDVLRVIQVCESMADQGTRNREIAAISEAMAELDVPEGTIVTRNESDRVSLENGIINVVPAWRFLLSLSADA
jgi:hypothetical protein